MSSLRASSVVCLNSLYLYRRKVDSNTEFKRFAMSTSASKLFILAGNDGRNTELREMISRADAAQLKEFLKSKTSGSRNILHAAAEMGCVQNLATITAALVKHGLLSDYIDSTCKVGMTPLHYAAKAHAKGCVKFLLDHGANVNAVNKTKNTPLHLASVNFQAWMLPSWFVNSFECIKILMEADEMDLTLKNSENETPLGISPSYWISSLKPTYEKSPRTPVTDPNTPMTPGASLKEGASTAGGEALTSGPDAATALNEERNITADMEHTETDSKPPPPQLPGTPVAATAPVYIWNGVPIENIKPLFDKDAKGEHRAASLRLMLRGHFVTLDPVTKAEVSRTECVIKSASTAEDAEPSKQNLIALKRECDIFKTMQATRDNTGCVKCFSSHPDYNYLLLESFGRDLRSLLANKTRHPAELFEAIAQAVRGLHSMEIVHGDIKPQNILFTMHPVTQEYTVKLCDLDCARRVGEECPAAEIGTKRYVAPEVYLAAAEGKTIKASLAFDMFSLGLVLWQLVQGSVMPALPSPETADEDLNRCYTDQQYLWSKLPLPEKAGLYTSFVRDLTKLVPLERMTAEQLVCRIPELSASYQQEELNKKEKVIEDLKKQYEHLSIGVDKKLDEIAKDVKIVMYELRDARADVDGMLRTLITNTHSIPTLAIILPKIHKPPTKITELFTKAKPLHLVKNSFRLFFICSHTRQVVTCGPKDRGYKFTVTREWVAQMAPVLRVGLLMLKLGLLAGGIPVSVPDISPLLKDHELYSKYVDAALSFVVDNAADNVDNAVASIDEVMKSVNKLKVQSVLDDYANGTHLEEGSQNAYDAIQRLLVEKEGYDVIGTCGLKMVTCKGKTAWVKNDQSVIRQFEESLR